MSNENVEKVVVLTVGYVNGKLVGLGSDSALMNVTDAEEIVKLGNKKVALIHAMETEDETAQHS